MSHTESMEENLAYWDHTGEDLESTSLLGSFRQEDATLYREKRRLELLSEEEIIDLIDRLDETSCRLQDYLLDLRDRKDNVTSSYKSQPSTSSYRFTRMCSCLKQYVGKLTGTKTIVFTLMLQGLNLLIQTIIDIWPRRDETTALIVSGFSMILLQLFNLILIIITAVKLASEMYHNRRVGGILLLQSYCASVLLFAGIYTVTRRLKIDSWKYLKEDVSEDPVLVVVLYTNFLFFSVSTATLCGSSDLSPNKWYNYILVSLQMLLSFMYFASIMGQCIPLLNQDVARQPVEKRRPIARSQTRSNSRSSSLQVQNYGSTST